MIWNTDAKSQSQGEMKISSADSMTKYVDPAISYTEHCVNVVLCYGMLLRLCVRREDTATLLRTRVSEHKTAYCDVFKTFAGSNLLLSDVVNFSYCCRYK